MKKLLLSIILLAACSLTLSAARSSQNEGKNVSVTGTEVVRTDPNTVSVAFQVQVGNEVTAKKRSLVIRPVLLGVGGQSELPAIVVRGTRAKVAAEDQAMKTLGIDSGGRYITSNGSSIEYWASIPWQDWMGGSQLILNGINAGKGKATEVNIGMVADNLLAGPASYSSTQAPLTQAPVAQAPLAQASAPVFTPAAQTPPPAVVQTPAPAVQVQMPAQAPVVQAQMPVQAQAPVFQTQMPVQVREVQYVQPSAVWQSQQNVQPVQVVQAPVYYVQPQDQGAVVQRSMPSYSRPVRDYSPVKGYYDLPERQHSIGTIGDELAARFTFVEPVARFNKARDASSIDAIFDYNMPLVFGTSTTREDDDLSRFIEMTRDGALYIKFERGSTMEIRDLGENNKMYVDLISAIRSLETNPDTRISQIVVVGFSAPEGFLDEKETLAMERAGATRDFITANSRVDPSIISIYNGSVDWVTLRALVSESNMPEKYKVLEIIDNVPAWNTSRKQSRMGRLMNLNDGEVFSYMRQNFFPQLRQTGAYVKVYYENMR